MSIFHHRSPRSQEPFGKIIIPKEVWDELVIVGKANFLLLDETDARNLAEFYGLPKTGVIGVLMRAKKKNLVKEIKPILEELRTQVHFWIKPDLYYAILSEMSEAPLR
jgi:predicted nucleic acid-binding protein